MATNIVHEHGDQLDVTVTAPATPNSGDPVLVGQAPGVALTDEQPDGKTTVKFNGVAVLTVKGETNADANSAVAVGDIIYYDAADTPVLNKDTTGVRFGYAWASADGSVTSGQLIAGGATASIRVKIGY